MAVCSTAQGRAQVRLDTVAGVRPLKVNPLLIKYSWLRMIYDRLGAGGL